MYVMLSERKRSEKYIIYTSSVGCVICYLIIQIYYVDVDYKPKYVIQNLINLYNIFSTIIFFRWM